MVDTLIELPGFFEDRQLACFLDASNLVNEWHEGDNLAWANAYNTVLLPDLEITASGQLLDQAYFFTVTGFSISNTGAAPIGASQIQFFLSKDRLLDNKDIMIATSQVDGIGARERIEQNLFQFKNALKIPNGAYYLGFRLVNQGEEEFSITNNQGFFPFDDLIVVNWTIYKYFNWLPK